MTLHEMVALKAAALGIGGAAAVTTMLAESSNALPLEWSGVVAMVGAAITYGKLTGKIEERQRQQEERQRTDDRRFARLNASNHYVEAAVTRVAEKLGVALSDLKAQFQTPEE